MELTLMNPSSVACFSKTIRYCKPKFQNAVNEPTVRSLCHLKSHEQRRKRCLESSALPETAASVVVAAVAVGAAATLLTRRTRASDPSTWSSLKICEDCGGSGICSECKGEGFILKKLTEESADKARMSAKNMATRYTAGLPKKWSYCSKCTSARSCSTCDGRGQVCRQLSESYQWLKSNMRLRLYVFFCDSGSDERFRFFKTSHILMFEGCDQARIC